MIAITPKLAIDEREIEEEFIRAAGPGGQNINKVATAVQLRFNVKRSPSLPEDVRERLLRLVGNRLTEDGDLIITARRSRTQIQNRQDALRQLVELIRKATYKPKPHVPTKPTFGSKQRRLESKRRQGERKRLRKSTSHSDD